MGSNKCDVLVTCGRFSYNIVRSLARKGLRVCVADSMVSAVKYSKYVSGFYTCPVYQEQEEAYLERLLELVRELHPKVLLPVFDFKLISRNRDLFSDACIVAVEDYEKIELLDDKIALTDFAGSLAVPTPGKIDPSRDAHDFPVVAKLPFGRSGNGVFFLKDRDELLSFTNKYGEEEYFITEYVYGTDYSVDCVRMNGGFHYSVYRSTEDSNFSKKPLIGREIVDDTRLGEYAGKILDALDYNGICGFDFRVDRSGNAYLLEANPRFTGGLGAEIAAGFDLPYILYSGVVGTDIPGYSINYGHKSESFFPTAVMLSRAIASGERVGVDIRERLSFRKNDFDDLFPSDFLYFCCCLFKNKKNLLRLIPYLTGIKSACR